MIRIWTKTYIDHKITRNYLHETDGKFDVKNFNQYVYDICGALDIPSPLILKSHIKNFCEFNIAKFLPKDYVEKVDFDYMTLENC